MTRFNIVYFGMDYHCPATLRRIQNFTREGAKVTVFAFKRNTIGQATWHHNFVCLGTVPDGNLASRMLRLVWVMPRVLKHANKISAAQVIYCRNLDAAFFGIIVRYIKRSRARIIYEVLDIHPLIIRSGWIGQLARWLERRVLKRTSLLVTSSKRFVDEYFKSMQYFDGPDFILENKLATEISLKPIELRMPTPLVIGYFGKFRCPESIRRLTEFSKKHPNCVQIRLAGVDLPETKKLMEKLRGLKNVTDLGSYKYPEDIPIIYQGVHLNWCLDLTEGLNSRLLLPNKLYEGCAMGVPALGEEGTATGDYILKQKIGIVIPRPQLSTLDAVLQNFTSSDFRILHHYISSQPRNAFFDIDQHKRLLKYFEHV